MFNENLSFDKAHLRYKIELKYGEYTLFFLYDCELESLKNRLD